MDFKEIKAWHENWHEQLILSNWVPRKKCHTCWLITEVERLEKARFEHVEAQIAFWQARLQELYDEDKGIRGGV